MSPLRDLIPSHVAPERLYLEARWSSLVPYAAAMFRSCPQSCALPRGFEHGFALRVVDAFTHKDGSDSGRDAFDRGHDPVCLNAFGLQV